MGVNETEQDILEKVHRDGFNARLANALPNSNPYQLDIDKWFAWLHGWRKADHKLTGMYRYAKERIEDSAELQQKAKALLERRTYQHLKRLVEDSEEELIRYAYELEDHYQEFGYPVRLDEYRTR